MKNKIIMNLLYCSKMSRYHYCCYYVMLFIIYVMITMMMTTSSSVSATRTTSKLFTTFLTPIQRNNNKDYYGNKHSSGNHCNKIQQKEKVFQINNNNNNIRNERRRISFLSSSSSSTLNNNEDIDLIQDNTDSKQRQQSTTNKTCTINTTTNDIDINDWNYNNLIAKSVFNITNNLNNNKPIFLFDGICQFCNFGVHFCIDHDPNFHLRYASLQSTIGKSLLISNNNDPNDISTLILVSSDTMINNKSDAVLYIIELLDGIPVPIRIMSRWCRKIVPKSIRDSIYNIISKNRHKIGLILSDDTCRIDLDSNRFVQDP